MFDYVFKSIVMSYFKLKKSISKNTLHIKKTGIISTNSLIKNQESK